MTDWLLWLLSALEEEAEDEEEEAPDLARREAGGAEPYDRAETPRREAGAEPAAHASAPDHASGAEDPRRREGAAITAPDRGGRAEDLSVVQGGAAERQAAAGPGTAAAAPADRQGSAGAESGGAPPKMTGAQTADRAGGRAGDTYAGTPRPGRETGEPHGVSRAGETPAERLWNGEGGRAANGGGAEGLRAGLDAAEARSVPQAERLPPAGAGEDKRRAEAGAWTARSGPEGGLEELSLSAAVRRTKAAVEEAGRLRQTGPIVLRAPDAPAQTVGAAELDRLFQRDARRYDGGFTLY